MNFTVKMTNKQFKAAFPEDFESYGKVKRGEHWELFLPAEESDLIPSLCVAGNGSCGDSWEFGKREDLMEALEYAGLSSLLEEC